MKRTKNAAGSYCPKQSGCSWAHRPKKDRVAKAAQSKPGGRAAKHKAEQNLLEKKIFTCDSGASEIVLGVFL